MLEGKIESLHSGIKCFAVYGRDDVIMDFVEYLRMNSPAHFDVRIIAGRDHSGRIKVAITGRIRDYLSFDALRHQFMSEFNM